MPPPLQCHWHTRQQTVTAALPCSSHAVQTYLGASVCPRSQSGPAASPVVHAQPAQHPIRRSRRHRKCMTTPYASSTSTTVLDGTDYGWAEEEDSAGDQDHIGSAFKATLGMLEWHRVCEHVASFSSTQAGRQACLNLDVPTSQHESEELLRLTQAALTLEYEYATILDFGGVNTGEGAKGIKRAGKAGLCSAVQLRAVASVVEGGEKLKKQVQVAMRENDAGGRLGPLAPLMPWVGRLKAQPVFIRQVKAAINDEFHILDNASDNLAQCRQRVKTLQARLANVLKGYGGEVSDKGGRVCVALPAGTKLPPASMLLGTSAGGGMVYVEPPAAVSLNNDLAAARGETYAAEEAVLYNLTNQLMGILHEVQDTYQSVVFLDVLAAKVRYGLWINGVLPTFVSWNRIFHERGAGASRQRMQAERAAALLGDGSSPAGADGAQEEEEEDWGGWTNAGGSREDAAQLAATSRYAVRLRNLRHPLLMGDYLKEKQRLERELRRSGIDPNQVLSGTGSIGGRAGGPGRPNGLSSKREGLLKEYGLGDAPGSKGRAGKNKAGNEDLQKLVDAYKGLKPPVPLDLAIKPHTSVVVITGPNTGGKTATMKALGLAVVMAKVGLPLPCDRPALLPAFTSVLADIGDEQSLTANLSTFSGHLTRIQALRAEADGKSLVLLDELGTGTDPVEGAALGVALLKHMVAGGMGGGALTIATTHHSMMTGLKFEDPQGRFENASVEFDQVALAPTYRLMWGIPGKSNALNIAARLGLDDDVVEAARSRLDTSVATSDDAITELEKLRTQLQEEETAMWAVQQEVQGLKRAAEVLRSELQVLQGQLGEAKEQALFEVWQAAKKRLERLRELKRVKGVRTPAAKKPEDVIKDLQQLQAELSGKPKHVSGGKEQQSRDDISAKLTLDDLVDARVDMDDLLDDLSAKQEQPAQEDRFVSDAKYDQTMNTLEAFMQLPGVQQSAGAQEASRVPPTAQTAAPAAAPAPDEYDAWMADLEARLERAEQRDVQGGPETGAKPASAQQPVQTPVASPRKVSDSSDDVLDELDLMISLMEEQSASGISRNMSRGQPRVSDRAGGKQEVGRGAAGADIPPSGTQKGTGALNVVGEMDLDGLDALILAIEDAPVPAPLGSRNKMAGRAGARVRRAGRREGKHGD